MSALDRPAVLAGLVALLCVIWGSTWFAIKVGLEYMPPFFAAAVRYLAASAVIAGLALARRVREPRGVRFHLALLVLGLLAFGVSFGVVYWGEQYVPAGLAAVLFATHPLLVSLIASRALADEALSARKLSGVLLGFAGVAVLMGDDVTLAHPRAPLAALVILVSPLVSAVTNVAIKRFGSGVHAFNLTSLPMFYGGAALLALSLLGEDWSEVIWSASAIGALLFLTLGGSCLAVVTFYTLLKRVAVSRLALISYVFPVIAVLLDVTLLEERFGSRALLGSALVMVGVATAGIRRRVAIAPVGGTRA